MVCRNICEVLSSQTKVGHSYYVDGRKYCRRCEIYLHYDGVFCPCCGMALRVTPSSRRDKDKLRRARQLQGGGS